MTSSLSPSSKRRLPGSSFFGGGSKGDSKSRKREDPRRQGSAVQFEGREGPVKRDKEEMIDNNVVEQLRKGLSYACLWIFQMLICGI